MPNKYTNPFEETGLSPGMVRDLYKSGGKDAVLDAADAIKRIAAKTFHPDVNSGVASEAFNKIIGAVDTIKKEDGKDLETDIEIYSKGYEVKEKRRRPGAKAVKNLVTLNEEESERYAEYRKGNLMADLAQEVIESKRSIVSSWNKQIVIDMSIPTEDTFSSRRDGRGIYDSIDKSFLLRVNSDGDMSSVPLVRTTIDKQYKINNNINPRATNRKKEINLHRLKFGNSFKEHLTEISDNFIDVYEKAKNDGENIRVKKVDGSIFLFDSSGRLLQDIISNQETDTIIEDGIYTINTSDIDSKGFLGNTFYIFDNSFQEDDVPSKSCIFGVAGNDFWGKLSERYGVHAKDVTSGGILPTRNIKGSGGLLGFYVRREHYTEMQNNYGRQISEGKHLMIIDSSDSITIAGKISDVTDYPQHNQS
ncbi:MAG: hypothetical protein LBC95_00135 [Candidatus Nomurabacteria bacterium]|jgi:hypothetical protein|nr:hypothetical protein [Candidatus Nomurabacteria bacterium]